MCLMVLVLIHPHPHGERCMLVLRSIPGDLAGRPDTDQPSVARIRGCLAASRHLRCKAKGVSSAQHPRRDSGQGCWKRIASHFLSLPDRRPRSSIRPWRAASLSSSRVPHPDSSHSSLCAGRIRASKPTTRICRLLSKVTGQGLGSSAADGLPVDTEARGRAAQGLS